MPTTYEFKCDLCGGVRERRLPMGGPLPKSCKCGTAGCPGRAVRQLTGGLGFDLGAVRNSYPYVSSRLPFAMAGAEHHGPLKKTVVASRQHEKRLLGRLGWTKD